MIKPSSWGEGEHCKSREQWKCCVDHKDSHNCWLFGCLILWMHAFIKIQKIQDFLVTSDGWKVIPFYHLTVEQGMAERKQKKKICFTLLCVLGDFNGHNQKFAFQKNTSLVTAPVDLAAFYSCLDLRKLKAVITLKIG